MSVMSFFLVNKSQTQKIYLTDSTRDNGVFFFLLNRSRARVQTKLFLEVRRVIADKGNEQFLEDFFAHVICNLKGINIKLYISTVVRGNRELGKDIITYSTEQQFINCNRPVELLRFFFITID